MTARFARSSIPAGPPFGYADLPVTFPGEIRGSLFAEFVPHSTPYDADQLARPWIGRSAHPRTVTARSVIRAGADLEFGWRAAVALHARPVRRRAARRA